VPQPWPESKGPRPGPPPELGPRAPVPSTPATALERERSEKDVISVMDLVAKEYNVDRSRLYVTGNSMGGAGTWYIGEKYADRFVAIAPSAGPVSPEEYPYDRLKHVAVLVIHGDHDQLTSIDASRVMVQHAKEHGVDVTFLEVKGGEHYMAWSHVVPDLFDFFDQHNKEEVDSATGRLRPWARNARLDAGWSGPIRCLHELRQSPWRSPFQARSHLGRSHSGGFCSHRSRRWIPIFGSAEVPVGRHGAAFTGWIEGGLHGHPQRRRTTTVRAALDHDAQRRENVLAQRGR
jgi:dienelactone hydrolase